VTVAAAPPGWRGALPPTLALASAGAAVAWALPWGLEPWRAAGIVSAWAGSALLVASLALMVREPLLARQLGGLQAMMSWHHRTGVTAYVLLLLHPLCLALDAWQEQPARAWQLLAPWQQSWPVWIGWAGLLLLMLGLAVTFARSVGYRRWRTWHQWLALGAVLGLAHVLVLLGSTALPLALAVVALAALGWRLLVTDRGLSALPYQVSRVSHPARDVVEAALQPLAGTLRPSAGQFVLARFVDSERHAACGEFHPFTVSGIGPGGELRLTIKALGACSAQIQSIAAGALVRLQGPFGNFLAEAGTSARLWVAGGIGITPFMAALRQQRCTRPTALLYLYRTPADAAFLAELQGLQTSDPMFQLLAQATGEQPPELGPLLLAVDRIAERQVHVCGPAPLLARLRDSLSGLGVPPAAIHSESFDFR
jgi:predicted ferric reductase